MINEKEKQNARELLEQGNVSCVLIKGKKTITKNMRGIAPLVELWESKEDLSGFCAADTIVGKAAALLLAGMGVGYVYARVMSQQAARMLKLYGIPFDFGVLTPAIRNRRGDGLCPMEEAVEKISDPALAYGAVKETLARLRLKNS